MGTDFFTSAQEVNPENQHETHYFSSFIGACFLGTSFFFFLFSEDEFQNFEKEEKNVKGTSKLMIGIFCNKYMLELASLSSPPSPVSE